MINGEWQELLLGEFCSFLYGKNLPQRKRTAGKVPVISSAGIIGTHGEALIDAAGIVIGRKGTLGNVTLSKTPFWPIDTAFYVLDAPHRNLLFTYYLLKSLPFAHMNSDSAVPGLNRDHAHSISLQIPPLSIQKRIAHVLGTLDDKIELNRKMNQTLEEMAQAIFKSWFVDFDPVHAKAEGRDTGLPPEIDALFPDSFVESELGLIPEGWEVKALDDVSNYLNGLAWKKYEAGEGEPSLPVIKIREMRQGITNACDRAKLTVPPEYIIQKGDILFSWSGTLLVTLWADAPGILNQHLFKVSSDTYPSWFSYYSTQNYLHRFQRIAADKATTMGHIRRKDLSEAHIPIPPQPAFNYISSIIEPVYDRIIETFLENSTLAQLRDTLLPKLLSGEVSVEDVEMEEVE